MRFWIDLFCRYLKPGILGDHIEIIAKTKRAGKTLGFLEIEIRDKETGDVLVTGTHTKYIGWSFGMLLATYLKTNDWVPI